MKIKFTVPPTSDVGSYSGTCSAGYYHTPAQDALADYNSARAHDGLSPLRRMPAGTKYHRPAAPWFINRRDGRTRETVDQFGTRKEARAMLAEYRMADPTAEHYVSRRACAGWNA